MIFQFLWEKQNMVQLQNFKAVAAALCNEVLHLSAFFFLIQYWKLNPLFWMLFIESSFEKSLRSTPPEDYIFYGP